MSYYICAICEYDKFRIFVEDGKEFVSCVNCGVIADIQVSHDGKELKLIYWNEVVDVLK